MNISLDFDQMHKHLEQPSQLDDQPLHGSQVEEHRDEEVEEVDDGQHLTIRIRRFLNKIYLRRIDNLEHEHKVEVPVELFRHFKRRAINCPQPDRFLKEIYFESSEAK